MANSKIALTILLTVLLAAAVNGSNIDLQIRNTFYMGDNVSFNYTITSPVVEQISYFATINCPQAPKESLNLKTASLQANIKLSGTYEGFIIDETIEPQNCTAIVQIMSPVQLTESKTFAIKTEPSFVFELKTCKDTSCSQQAKVFTMGSAVFLQSSAAASGKVTYPDGTSRAVNLPVSIMAEQLGTYTLEVTASAAGYKTTTKTELFAVIEKNAEIAFVGVCTADGVCSGREHHQNCPQDCPSGGRDGYCDKLSDSVCDPDCAAGGDYDCAVQQQQKGTVRMLILVIAILVIVITAVLLIYGRQAGGRKMLTETQDLELRNYILAALSKGHSREQIKKQLISLGWKEEQIKRFFR